MALIGRVYRREPWRSVHRGGHSVLAPDAIGGLGVGHRSVAGFCLVRSVRAPGGTAFHLYFQALVTLITDAGVVTVGTLVLFERRDALVFT